MSGKKALSELYHVAPKGFWKKFREVASVNSTISSGLPLQSINRQPPPGSRPEKYATPATKASDPAQNPYWKRDVRRAYPQLSIITQPELAALLIDHAPAPQLAEPTEPGQAVAAASESSASSDLVAAIAQVTQSGHAIYTPDRLPPAIPSAYKKWTPAKSADPPHEAYSDMPMFLVH